MARLDHQDVKALYQQHQQPCFRSDCLHYLWRSSPEFVRDFEQRIWLPRFSWSRPKSEARLASVHMAARIRHIRRRWYSWDTSSIGQCSLDFCVQTSEASSVIDRGVPKSAGTHSRNIGARPSCHPTPSEHCDYRRSILGRCCRWRECLASLSVWED